MEEGVPNCPRCSNPIPAGSRYCSSCGSSSSAEAPRAPAGMDDATPPGLPPRYEVLRLLGIGGMGKVFLCRDTRLDVEVAVKVLPDNLTADSASIQQIEKEARAAARFRQAPGILSLYGFEQYGHTWYLVMEYAAGGSLHDLLEIEGPRPEEECRRIGAEVAEALAFAHERKVLHRDIKPANILLDADGHAKVADFGIAKVMAETSMRMSAAHVVGTPMYMAPEIIQQKPVDGRADLYSLGCLLYTIATGERPFRGSPEEIIIAKTRPGAVAPDPRVLVPGLSEEFASVVRRLLAQDPDDRYADGIACGAALRAGLAPAEREPSQRTGGTPTGPPPSESPTLGVNADWEAPTRTLLRTPTAGPGIPGDAVGVPAGAPPEKARRSRIPVLSAVLAAALLAWAGLALRGLSPGGAGGPPAAPPAPGPSVPPAPAPDPAPPPPPAPPPGLWVMTDPPGATVTVDGVEIGVAGPAGLLAGTAEPGREHVIKAWLDDHDPVEVETVRWEPGTRREVRLALRRLEGTLRLEGGLPGLAVLATLEGAAPRELVLGEDGSLGPVPLGAGEYAFRAERPGFEPWLARARVSAHRLTTLRVGLLERPGSLALATDPAGAEVFVDDALLGTTPLRPRRMAPGRHTLRISHPETDEVVREVVIRGDEALDLGRLTLPPLAILDLEGLPEGVAASAGGTPLSGKVRRRSGEVAVVFRRERHRDQEVLVTLRPGETAAPRPGPWVPVPGRLLLPALPAGAEVLVDGKAADPAAGPLAVEPGPHAVLFRREGFHPVPEVRVVVEAGQDLPVEQPRWKAVLTLAPAVPDLPPPPEPVLAEQRALEESRIPEGFLRDARGRIWCARDGAEVVLVPAGEFVMGSDEGGLDEKPVHRVFVSAFLADRHEVTAGQYRKYCAEKGVAMPEQGEGASDLTPVVNVGWEEAVSYLAWAGRRLPTEAEWEKAARGTDGRVFPWGGVDDETRRNGGGARDGFQGASPVASYPAGASPYGCFDMSGNVWEWCADWYGPEYYAASPARDPRGPGTGTDRVLRSSSWLSVTFNLRAPYRFKAAPSSRFGYYGFRGAASLP